MAYLIDTDWVVHHLAGVQAVTSRLESYRQAGLAVPIPVLAELYEGAFYSSNPEASQARLEEFLAGVDIILADEQTARIFARERGRLRRQGRRIGDFDLLIAAIALQHDLILLSNNRTHFERVPGLELESVDTTAPKT